MTSSAFDEQAALPMQKTSFETESLLFLQRRWIVLPGTAYKEQIHRYLQGKEHTESKADAAVLNNLIKSAL